MLVNSLDRLLFAFPRVLDLSNSNIKHCLQDLSLPHLLASPHASAMLALRYPYPNPSLGKLLDSFDIGERLELPVLIRYISTVAKIKQSHLSPGLYAALEQALVRRSMLGLNWEEIHIILTHYRKHCLYPPIEVLEALSLHMKDQMDHIRVKDIALILKFMSAYRGIIPKTHPLETLLQSLFQNLGELWPWMVYSLPEYSYLISIIQSLAILECTDVQLWTNSLRHLFMGKIREKKLAARVISMSKLILETLHPEVVEQTQSLWEPLFRLYPISQHSSAKSENDTKLAAQVTAVLETYGVRYKKGIMIEGGFMCDILIHPGTILEVDGPFHYIRRSDETQSRTLLWSQVIRDKVLRLKGYTVIRILHTDIDCASQTQVTEIVKHAISHFS